MSTQPPEGEQKLVAECMSDSVKRAAALIEAEMLESYKITFAVDGKEFVLELRPLPSSKEEDQEPTYNLTAKQLSEIYSAGAEECFKFAGFPSEYPAYVKEMAAEYLKEKFGIDITTIQ